MQTFSWRGTKVFLRTGANLCLSSFSPNPSQCAWAAVAVVVALSSTAVQKLHVRSAVTVFSQRYDPVKVNHPHAATLLRVPLAGVQVCLLMCFEMNGRDQSCAPTPVSQPQPFIFFHANGLVSSEKYVGKMDALVKIGGC